MFFRRLIIVTVVLVTLDAKAAQRTFVSAGNGSDSNPCTRQLPCRNFAAAISQTDAGGEVVVLDSGGYGPATINQAISLIAPAGIYTGITAFSGNAITVDSALTLARVVIRGLTLNSLGGGIGIDHSGGSGASGNSVYIENCIVTGFGIRGINLSRSGRFYVHDTISRRNGDYGIYVTGDAGAASQASLRKVILEQNGEGGLAVDNADVAVRDSVASSNDQGPNGYGFYARAEVAGQFARVNLDHCQATHNNAGFLSGFPMAGSAQMYVANSHAAMNGYGVAAFGSGAIRVSNTSAVQNTIGFFRNETAPAATFESRGNNNVKGNGTDKAGTITTYSE